VLDLWHMTCGSDFATDLFRPRSWSHVELQDFIEIKSLSSRALLCLSMKFLLLMVDGVFTKCIFCPTLWKYQLTISIGSSGKRLALTASTWCDQPLMQHHATHKWLKWKFYGYTCRLQEKSSRTHPTKPLWYPRIPSSIPIDLLVTIMINKIKVSK